MAERPTILVVDDDQSIRMAVAWALDDAGYSVVTAEHGRSALSQLTKLRPNLVLLDMRMPVMDGWTFARQYRAMAEGTAPIIVMTAAHDARAWAEQVNATGHLAKPFGIDELLEIVQRHLSAEKPQTDP